MKEKVTQTMQVTMNDGSKVTVCCGPMALRLLVSGKAKGYTPTTDPATKQSCCHT